MINVCILEIDNMCNVNTKKSLYSLAFGAACSSASWAYKLSSKVRNFLTTMGRFIFNL